MTKKVVVEVEVPDEIARLLEKAPWLKEVIAEEGIRGLRRRMELQAQLDLLTPDIDIDEKTILEMDKIIKKSLARRLENENNNNRH